MKTIVRRHDGTVEKLIGDAAMGYLVSAERTRARLAELRDGAPL